MELFGEYRGQSIGAFKHVPVDLAGSLIKADSIATLEDAARGQITTLMTDRAVLLSEKDLKNQFLLFQFNEAEDGPPILHSPEVSPVKNGSDEKPDASVMVQLSSFNVGSDEDIDRNTRATLRLDFCKDPQSSSSLDTLFWAIAAGLNLYNEAKGKKSEAKDLNADFSEAVSRKPAEIPGGLAKLSFEVVKHREPRWWQKVFSFLQSGTGTALTSAIGFPAITGKAIGVLNELLNQLDRSNPESLFKSVPTTLALTERARKAYLGGSKSATVGVLNPGFCLLVRGRDYKTLVDNSPIYEGALGLLRPKDMSTQDFLQSPESNPFNKMTYAVLRVRVAETKLNPPLDF